MKNTLFSFINKSKAAPTPRKEDFTRKRLQKERDRDLSDSHSHDSRPLFQMKEPEIDKDKLVQQQASKIDEMLKKKKGSKRVSTPPEDARNKILSGKGKLKRKKQEEPELADFQPDSIPQEKKTVIAPEATKKTVPIDQKRHSEKKRARLSSSQSSDISLSKERQKKKRSPRRKSKKSYNKIPTADQPLAGQTIVLSGINSYITKDKLKDLLLSLGAKVPGTVSGKTTALLVGRVLEDGKQPHQGNKYKQSLQKGVRIVHQDQIDAFFIDFCNKNLHELLNRQKYSLQVQKMGIVEEPSTIRGDQHSMLIEELLQKKKKELDTKLWTDKYAPKELKDILGNAPMIEKLKKWLLNWQDVHFKGLRHDEEKVFSKMPAGSMNSKACLISGQPGIGKTTSVRLIAEEIGYTIVQYNASDVRSKKRIENLELGSFKLSRGQMTKSVILMDEVDGMSSGDRGGIKSIIEQIKKSKNPIVCICNDRGHQKIRSLAGHCLDLRFKKTNKNQIATRLEHICQKEGLKTDINSLQYLCQTMNNDIRQVITFLQFYAKSHDKLQYMQVKDRLKTQSKDVTGSLSHFDAATRLLNRAEFSQMNLYTRNNLVFVDSEFVPLLIHQNLYTSTIRKETTAVDLKTLANATQAIAQSDIVNKAIRGNQEWALMPGYAFLSSVYPTEKLSSRIPFPKFPQWLGKFSSQRKTARLLTELREKTANSLMTSTRAINLDYTGAILQHVNILAKNNRAQEICAFLHNYGINSNVFKENLLQVQFNPQKKDIFPVAPQFKRKLTTLMKNGEQAEIEKRKGKGKGKKETAARQKFDPLLEEFEQAGPQEDQAEDSSKVPSERGKSKAKSKGRKK